MIVMKFGGTSTQDASAIANVAQIIARNIGKRPVVTISAIARATNVLEQSGRYASEGDPAAGLREIESLIGRHHGIINALIRNKERSSELARIFDAAKEELTELIRGIAILRELTPRTLDTLYSYGELLSSRIVSAALGEIGIPSQWIDTKDFMVTDDRFNRALPMMELVEKKLKAIVFPLAEKNIVPVTQGFIGVTASGRRTTMGRESSDYSAAIIGAVLDAEDIQIWTDVDGVLTADPRIVKTPKKVKVLSFEEAYELSYFGAKVLHPNTMLPAIDKNIPIHIYNSLKPELSGTRITGASMHSDPVVKSIASIRNIMVVTVKPKKRYGQYIFWEHLLNIFTKHNIAVAMSVTSEYQYSLVIETKQFSVAFLHDLAEIGETAILEKKGIVCIVGTNIRNAPGFINRIFKMVSDAGVTLISFGASKSNLGFVIDDEIVDETVCRMHDEFFGSANNSDLFEDLN